jgi:3-oxoacyl-[acyl-carrier-protein] synthase II
MTAVIAHADSAGGSRRPRIVVTGVGAVSAWGWGHAALRDGLRSGETAIRPFTRFEHAKQRTHIAGEVPAEGSARAPGCWPRLSVADRYALFAADEAVREAGLRVPLAEPGIGVYFASATAGLHESELYLAAAWTGARARPGLLASQQLNGPGDAVARQLGVTGPVLTISSACASATLALEAALRDLRSGAVELAIAGGADSLCLITYSGFNALRAVDERPCRPYRRDRAGMSLGEGAGVLVLETEAHAARRGARAIAELRGAGASCDASHMTAPQPGGEGAALAMTRALADAGARSDDVAFVNVHGTGTPLNDTAESEAMRRVFGERARRVPLTATKASIGHLLGSAGAIEAVATVLCLRDREVDPTAGAGEIDPSLALDLVLDRPRAVGDGVALSLNLAFGGANAAVVFGRWAAG